MTTSSGGTGVSLARGSHASTGGSEPPSRPIDSITAPRIADTTSGPDLLPIILAIGLIWLFIAYLCVSWLFRPIRAIRQGAAKIGKGNFEHRITGYRQDQLGDLAEDVNRLAGDVRGMLDAKRQLLLGISHELRSPLSRLRLGLEFIDDSEQKEGIRAEIAEMEEIISALLEAERLNTRHAPIRRSRVLVGELLEQLVDTYFERDSERIAIEVEDDGLEASVDEVRVTLMLKNLVSNALRYGGDGPVTIRASEAPDGLMLSVTDRGEGFSEEQRASFGEPFYRGDPSRTRETGGYGLGLYLAKLVAEAHGGTLAIDPEYRDGARLVAILPG